MKIQKLKTWTKFAFLILSLLLTTASLAQAIMPPWYQAFSAIAASTGANVTVTLPAHQADDILLLSVVVRDQNDTITVAGWTQIATVDRGAVSRYWWFWKRAASSAETNPLVAKSTGTGNTYAVVITYRGAITTGDPWEVKGTPQTGTADPMVLTGITTVSADSLVVAAVAGENNNNNSIITTGTDPAAYTEHYVESAVGADGVITFSEAARTTAGATGNVSVNWSNAIPNGDGGILLALKPPPVMATIYAINNSLTPNGAIMRINPANSVATIVYSGAPFVLANRAAGLAQCPDGMLYFIGQTGTLYRFNPNTPSVAPVVIGNTGLDMIRMTCHPTTGVLYGMPSAVNNLYTINTTTAATTAIPLTLPGITPPANGSGDIGFDADGTLHFVGEGTAGNAATVRLWIINLATNTFENLGAVTGLPNVANGIAFDNSGNVFLSLTGQTQLYTVSVDGGAAAAIGIAGAMPAAVFDLSSVNVLLFTKTNNSAFSPGVPFTYTVVLSAGAVVNNAVFTDPVVANLNVSNVTCVAAGGAVCPAVTVAAMQGAGSTIPFMPIGGSVTFTITANVTGNPTGMLTNTATVTLSGQTNSASDTDAIKKVLITRWREVY